MTLSHLEHCPTSSSLPDPQRSTGQDPLGSPPAPITPLSSHHSPPKLLTILRTTFPQLEAPVTMSPPSAEPLEGDRCADAENVSSSSVSSSERATPSFAKLSATAPNPEPTTLTFPPAAGMSLGPHQAPFTVPMWSPFGMPGVPYPQTMVTYGIGPDGRPVMYMLAPPMTMMPSSSPSPHPMMGPSAYQQAPQMMGPPGTSSALLVPAVPQTADSLKPESIASSGKRKMRERKYACDQCPNRYTRKEHLRRHQLGHLGVKLFGCTICKKRFTRKQTLEYHMGLHEKEATKKSQSPAPPASDSSEAEEEAAEALRRLSPGLRSEPKDKVASPSATTQKEEIPTREEAAESS